MERYFNIAGPCVPGKHYMVPALERLPEVTRLIDASYAQLAGYLDTLGLAEGWMTVFDPDPAKSWDEKIYNRDETVGGKTIHIVGA